MNDPGLLKALSRENDLVFLDTAGPGAPAGPSYLFTRPVRILKTRNYAEIPSVLAEADRLRTRYFLAGYIAYEAGVWLEEKLRDACGLDARSRAGSDLIWLGAYEKPLGMDSPRLPAGKTLSGKERLSLGISKAEYTLRVREIKRWIAKGHTYQVNFTFDARYHSPLRPVELYAALRRQQPTPYCAFIRTGEREILSFSPELFFRIDKGRITVKPMKGTAPRGLREETDRALRLGLAQDAKNRAENLMIVDLLRNDLGRICRTGSVRVNRLFEVEAHSTLFQMTSTIEGRLRPGTGFGDVIRAIFPSGSVTGAPKIRTMEIIRSLEKGTRGVYCGAIGFLSPGGHAVFSVPIRTLQRNNMETAWQYRVGSGIVWDSGAKSEWEECRTKCDFLLLHRDRPFEILESLLFDKRFVFLKEHAARMKKTALRFGYDFDGAALRALLEKTSRSLRGPHKVRILLNARGGFRSDAAPLRHEKDPDMLFISKTPVDPDNIFLYHKTTRREWYDAAIKNVNKGLCYDVAFFNKQGQVTEGARTNLFARIKGRLYTPPVECGLLPGVLRQRLLATGKCAEKILTLKDLKEADAVYAGNSVRGLKKVTVAL